MNIVNVRRATRFLAGLWTLNHMFFRATGKLLNSTSPSGTTEWGIIQYSAALRKIMPSGTHPPPPLRSHDTAWNLQWQNWQLLTGDVALRRIRSRCTNSSRRSRIIAVTGLRSRGLTQEGEGMGTLMYHSSELRTLPLLQYENITVMKILSIGVASF